MKELHIIFEHFSYATGVGVQIMSVSGEIRYASSLLCELKGILNRLLDIVDCAAAERMSLICGCYQSRRFGGRYIFFGPSGLAYCASPMLNSRGVLESGVVAGPFLMTDHDEYLSIDILDRLKVPRKAAALIESDIAELPYKSPIASRSLSEHLFLCAFNSDAPPPPAYPIQIDGFAYPFDKEDALLKAISQGDTRKAGALLNDILGQVLFHSGSSFETLRSRVFELTVLLSRAALKGSANVDAIFGLNYAYLRELDELSSVEDIVRWLHGVTRRFGQHVFDFAGSRHAGVIYKATSYIKANYMHKITLQDMANHVFLSPTYFSKLFKEETGQTPGNFLTAVRIDESKRLLRSQALNIVDIPARVGFDNQSYFARVFKKFEGQTPGKYRRDNC